ncbi:hypothetical protein BHM03_00021866 [Ensete ventricosum]|uniref:Uncharacterized protein n=1 Tax=Ensete ventricosum TaxID=4639 RepID=A0A445MGC1_ENSVE|nr:hypothetical protein BHM03_00021866 [Ensete ventricosum]
MPPHPHYVATAAPACRQPPCQGAPAPAASVAPVGGTSVGVDPIGTSLLAVGLAEDDSPLRAGAWPWLANLARGLAVASHPCRGREENRRGGQSYSLSTISLPSYL